ncbi:hypothetical protein BTURTLESOX_1459 [bacterium endosymbiont of Bathymodiolus sp. 5 South]|nr:hypothetical protein BTURTLESOX_1459 [bacterium endosymbiont of Bathymodiolus sp. 5 South]
MQSLSCAILHSAFASERAPVEVSACTNAKIFASVLSFKACSTLSKETAVPQSSSTTTATPPKRVMFSCIRIPNTPLIQTTTLSPGSTKLAKQVSIPAEPGADTGMVNSFSVLKMDFKPSLVSFIMPTKAGSRCPIVGRAIADRMRGCTSLGPGPISVLIGGLNDFIVL